MGGEGGEAGSAVCTMAVQLDLLAGFLGGAVVNAKLGRTLDALMVAAATVAGMGSWALLGVAVAKIVVPADFAPVCAVGEDSRQGAGATAKVGLGQHGGTKRAGVAWVHQLACSAGGASAAREAQLPQVGVNSVPLCRARCCCHGQAEAPVVG